MAISFQDEIFLNLNVVTFFPVAQTFVRLFSPKLLPTSTSFYRFARTHLNESEVTRSILFQTKTDSVRTELASEHNDRIDPSEDVTERTAQIDGNRLLWMAL